MEVHLQELQSNNYEFVWLKCLLPKSAANQLGKLKHDLRNSEAQLPMHLLQ